MVKECLYNIEKESQSKTKKKGFGVDGDVGMQKKKNQRLW